MPLLVKILVQVVVHHVDDPDTHERCTPLLLISSLKVEDIFKMFSFESTHSEKAVRSASLAPVFLLLVNRDTTNLLVSTGLANHLFGGQALVR